MNILLTTPAAPKKSPFFTTEKRPPLGLGSLISVARGAGHKVHFIDNYLRSVNFIQKGFLQEHNIDLVGVSVNTICYRDSLRIFRAIDRLRSKGLWNGTLVAGGPHTAVGLDTIPEFVDHVVLGEGERAILEIADGGVKERIIKEKRMTHLDSLPFQPWDLFAELPYDYTCSWLEAEPVFTMNTSRGCPFKCTFCSVGSIWGKRYTYFSAERVVAEIEYLVEKYGAKGIYFREDNFTLNLQRTMTFCDILLRKKLDISWACETRVNNLSEETVKLMSRAGCKAFYLGVESGSERMLKLMNKDISVTQIENTINWCKKYGIRAYCSLVTGIPGETYEDYLQTKRLMERLRPYDYGFNVFVAMPGSELYEAVIVNKLYEYIDDLGLAYLPGFNVKSRFFYGLDGKHLVDHTFTKKTEYDQQLLAQLHRLDFKRTATAINNNLDRILPHSAKMRIKRFKKAFMKR
jgi:radical SAM superfamily enzyme YgiQ (UPF0313 family)